MKCATSGARHWQEMSRQSNRFRSHGRPGPTAGLSVRPGARGALPETAKQRTRAQACALKSEPDLNFLHPAALVLVMMRCNTSEGTQANARRPTNAPFTGPAVGRPDRVSQL